MLPSLRLPGGPGAHRRVLAAACRFRRLEVLHGSLCELCQPTCLQTRPASSIYNRAWIADSHHHIGGCFEHDARSGF